MDQRFAYDAYGQLIQVPDWDFRVLSTLYGALTNQLYSGERTETMNGSPWGRPVQYLRARFYDPATGRFATLDPCAGDTHEPLSHHKYVYGNGNPISNSDPLGLFSLPSILIGTSIGATIGALTNSAIAYARGASMGQIGRAALRGTIIGAVGGALFPSAAGGLAGVGANGVIQLLGASAISGAGTGALEAIWDGQNVAWGAAQGTGLGIVFGGVFGLVGKGLTSVSRQIAQGPIDDVSRQLIDDATVRLNQVAASGRFRNAAGLVDDPALQTAFDNLLRRTTVATTGQGGAQIGYISVRQADGSVRTVLGIALSPNSGPNTIRHELFHLASEARTVVRGGQSIFLAEIQQNALDPRKWWTFLREETVAWSRTIATAGGF